MATKLAAEPKADPKATEFEAQKAAFEAAVAKTKADGDTPPEVHIPESDPEKPEAKPAKPEKKAKKSKQEPSALEQEVAALRSQLTELSKAKAEPEVDERQERARARLAERFGEEEADAMLETFEDLRGDDKKELAEMRRILEEATKAGRQNLSKSNQKRLVAAHPQLKNGEAWEMVHDRALAAYQKDPKKYDSIEDAYDAVVQALYGEPDEGEGDDEDPPEEVERTASRIAASQMTVPTKVPRRENRSKEERAKEHFDYLKKNPEDLAGAKRLAKELGLR